jgi:hypothetical protein
LQNCWTGLSQFRSHVMSSCAQVIGVAMSKCWSYL